MWDESNQPTPYEPGSVNLLPFEHLVPPIADRKSDLKLLLPYAVELAMRKYPSLAEKRLRF